MSEIESSEMAALRPASGFGQVVVPEAGREIHLSEPGKEIGVKFVVGASNSVVEVKATKQADDFVVITTVFRNSTPSAAHMNRHEQANQEIRIPGEARLRLELVEGDNNTSGEEKWKKEMPGWLMVLATLVLSVTYQAGINPPGGVWQDDTTGIGGHTAGEPVHRYKHPNSFLVFKVCNTLALSQSLVVVILLVKRGTFQAQESLDAYTRTLRVLVVTSLLALATAYSVSEPNHLVLLVFCLIFVNGLISAVLAKGVSKNIEDAINNATKKLKPVKLWAIVGLGVLSFVFFFVDLKRASFTNPWVNFSLGFLYIAGTILWVQPSKKTPPGN